MTSLSDLTREAIDKLDGLMDLADYAYFTQFPTFRPRLGWDILFYSQ